MEPLTQTYRGSVIDTFALYERRGTHKTQFCHFSKWPSGKFRFPLTTREPLTQTCGGSVIDTFAVRATGNAQNPILSFFIMAEREISISVNNDWTLDPNLWGVSNWHFCCMSNGERTKPNFVIFHNGRAGNFDFRQQRWNRWTKLMGGR